MGPSEATVVVSSIDFTRVRRRNSQLLTTLAAQNWGMFVLRGVLALAFGVLAFAAPGPTLAALIFAKWRAWLERKKAGN